MRTTSADCTFIRFGVPLTPPPAWVGSVPVKVPVAPISVSAIVSISPVRWLTTSTDSVPVPARSTSSTESCSGSPTMPATIEGWPSVPPTTSVSVMVCGTPAPLAASL